MDGELFLLSVSSSLTLSPKLSEAYLLRSREEDSSIGWNGFHFWIVDAAGQVLSEFGPEFSCDCEYGLPVIYELRDGTLFKYSGRSNDAYSDALCQWKAEVVCHVWRKLDPAEPTTRAVFAALRLHEGPPADPPSV